VSKVITKLNVWKGRFLSLTSRICIIKLIFTSVPLFYLSFFKVPNFSMKFVYEWLTNNIRGPHHDIFSHLWRIKASPSVLTTTWRVMVDRMPTRVNLTRRGVKMPTLVWVMCQGVNESSVCVGPLL